MKQRLLVSGRSAVEERKKRTMRMSLQQHKCFCSRPGFCTKRIKTASEFVAHIFVVMLTDVNAPFLQVKERIAGNATCVGWFSLGGEWFLQMVAQEPAAATPFFATERELWKFLVCEKETSAPCFSFGKETF